MEQLIILALIAGASLLHGWWKKRQEAESESEPGRMLPPLRRPGTPPTGRSAPEPSPAASWEEELRRLLQGEQPPRRPQPPVVTQAPPPLPPVFVGRPSPVRRPPPVSQSDPDMDRGLPVRMPTLEHSAQAFLRASNIESKVAEHMQRAGQQVASHKTLEIKREVAPEIRQAVSLVRNRQSQRAAIIAGMVLGPPKAMEV